jgi:arsenate reductase (thioredoxin)
VTGATSGPPAILFLCVHNAGRSQIAAAFAREMGGGRIVVHSAGSDPGESLNPAVVEAMKEVGLDITGESPRRLTEEMGLHADVIVTMGCGDACPVYLGKRYEDWELEDPRGKDLNTVRAIRDDIRDRVRALVSELAF